MNELTEWAALLTLCVMGATLIASVVCGLVGMAWTFKSAISARCLTWAIELVGIDGARQCAMSNLAISDECFDELFRIAKVHRLLRLKFALIKDAVTDREAGHYIDSSSTVRLNGHEGEFAVLNYQRIGETTLYEISNGSHTHHNVLREDLISLYA